MGILWRKRRKWKSNTQYRILYNKNNNDQRTFMAIGQEYNLISYSELMNQDFLSIIWLKRKYTFE